MRQAGHKPGKFNAEEEITMAIRFNTDKAYKAYKALRQAQKSLDGARKYADRWPNDAKRAEALAEAAQAAYSDSIAKLAQLIADAEGRATARTISPDTVMEWIDAINDRLGIAKTRMAGITATVTDGAQHFPSAYKYKPEATAFTMRHNGKGWIVTDIYRTGCNYATRAEITLTDDAKQAVIESVSKI